MTSEIGLLLITHGNFGESALASVELIIGKQTNYQTMNVFIIDDIVNLKTEIQQKIELLNMNAGLVVMTDILGGTPINLASELLTKPDVIVLSGLNLPLLITFFMERTSNFFDLKHTLSDAYNAGFVIRTADDLIQTGGEADEYSL